MANTYTLIASATAGSGGTQVFDFTSIPSTYTDLLLRVSARTNFTSSAFGDFFLIVNGGTTSSYRTLYGGQSSAGSGNASALNYMEAGFTNASPSTANTFSSHDIYIPNYAGSTNKSISIDAVQENNLAEAFKFFVAGLASTTSVINRLTISGGTTASGLSTNSFVQYSTASLYGIKNS